MIKEEITKIPSFEIKKEDNYLGNAINFLRIESNWSKKKMAQVSKISAPTLHRVEKKGSMPRFETILKIAKTFKISPLGFILFSFKKIKFDTDFKGSINLFFSDCNSFSIGNGDLTEENYGIIKLMVGRKKTRTQKKPAK